jgi:hypothetical protein
MDLSGDNLVALATLIFGAGGVYKGVEKGIAYLWKKRQERLGRSCQFAKIGDCAKLHETLLTNVGSMFNSALQRMEKLSNDIKDMTAQRTFEDGIKRKRDVIIANAITFMRHNKGVHDFAMHKSERFVDFILANYKTMWKYDDVLQDPCSLFNEKIKSLAIAVKEEGKAIADDEYVNFFYDNFHQESTDRYLNDVASIFKDRVNNKSERFVDTSMSFLQRFLSEMVEAYMQWMKESFEQEHL